MHWIFRLPIFLLWSSQISNGWLNAISSRCQLDLGWGCACCTSGWVAETRLVSFFCSWFAFPKICNRKLESIQVTTLPTDVSGRRSLEPAVGGFKGPTKTSEICEVFKWETQLIEDEGSLVQKKHRWIWELRTQSFICYVSFFSLDSLPNCRSLIDKGGDPSSWPYWSPLSVLKRSTTSTYFFADWWCGGCAGCSFPPLQKLVKCFLCSVLWGICQEKARWYMRNDNYYQLINHPFGCLGRKNWSMWIYSWFALNIFSTKGRRV